MSLASYINLCGDHILLDKPLVQTLAKNFSALNTFYPPQSGCVFYRIGQKLEWYKLEPVAHTIDDHIANSKVELHTLALVYYTSSFIQHISMILI